MQQVRRLAEGTIKVDFVECAHELGALIEKSAEEIEHTKRLPEELLK